MHKDSVERARLERVQALEREINAKQRRAEQLRAERLKQKKGLAARFGRRPLEPSSTTTAAALEPSDENAFVPRKQTATSFALAKKVWIEDSPPPSKNEVQSKVLQRLNDAGPFRRCLRPTKLSDGHIRALSAGTASKSSSAHPRAAISEQCESFTPRDDIWTGRGLVVDESELRKASLLDSTPRTDRSSSRGSLQEFIEAKATARHLPGAGASSRGGESLSHTPKPHCSLFYNMALQTSPKPLSTVNEGHPLLHPAVITVTPQVTHRTSHMRRSIRNFGPNSSTLRHTPRCRGSPGTMCSPCSFGAPRRRGVVGRQALIVGISTGTPAFVENLRKKYDEDLNSLIPIPPRLAHLFSYTNSNYTTPLSLAVKSSSADLVKALIEGQADAICVDECGRSLLHQMFLPLPDALQLSSHSQPPPYRIRDNSNEPAVYPPPAAVAAAASPRSSLLQTPRINDVHPRVDGTVGKCRILEAAQPMWASNMDNKANMVELLVCSAVSPTLRDSAGFYASDYAKIWLNQAHAELSNEQISPADKISACCVRAACVALLTLEDYLRLSYIAPLATSYQIRKLLRPRLGFEFSDGRSVNIYGTLLQADQTPDRLLGMVRGKSQPLRPAKQQKATVVTDPLHMFMDFAKKHEDHPAHLRILEFLGASFVDSSNSR